MLNVLALDTTSKHPSLAVRRDKQLYREYNFISHNNLSAKLIPALDFILKDSELTLQDIDLFAAAVGPGFFTGIRVGLATLKGLLFGMDKPVAPVTSLEAWAGKCVSDKEIVALIDAKRGEVYAASYRRDSQNLCLRVAPVCLPPEQLADILSVRRSYCFVGSGALVYAQLLSNMFTGSTIVRRNPFLADEIGTIGEHMFERGDYLRQVSGLRPFYIRKPDAEMST